MSAEILWYEGSDYCGKTTQIKKMEKYLISKGFKVFVMKEPGSTNSMKSVRELVLSNIEDENDKLSYLTRRLLYAADHAQALYVLSKIKDDYDYILIDRYTIVSDYIYGPCLAENKHYANTLTISNAINKCYQSFYDMIEYQPPKNAKLILLNISNNTLKERNDKRMSTPGYVKDVFDIQKFEKKVSINIAYNAIANAIRSDLVHITCPTMRLQDFQDIIIVDADNNENVVFETIIKGVGVE